jgi:hypothetical protein
MRRLGFALTSTVLVLAGCGGASGDDGNASNAAGSPSPTATAAAPSPPSLPGCAPQCLPQNGRPGGAISGSYTTTYFLGGFFSAAFPTGWTATDDNTNELMFESSPDGYLLFAWIDPFAQLNGRTARGVGRTPAAMINWLLHEPSFVAARGPSTLIGTSFAAQTVDISIAPGAHSNPAVPECPSVCVDYFGIPNLSTSPHGLARPGATRLFFSEIQYGGQKHLLALSVEVLRKPDLARAVAATRGILASIRIPATPA